MYRYWDKHLTQIISLIFTETNEVFTAIIPV